MVFFKVRVALSKAYFLLFTWVRSNFVKIVIVFTIGFSSRFLINFFLGVNVFVEYMHWVSIFYYLNFSCVVIYINSIDFNLFKNFSWDYISYDNIYIVYKLYIFYIIRIIYYYLLLRRRLCQKDVGVSQLFYLTLDKITSIIYYFKQYL